MQLREWQERFQNAVRGTDTSEQLPLRSQGLERQLSIGIYANAYRERLHEALRNNYPALQQLLGDRDFAEMAYAFMRQYPPHTASIRWFGEKLSHYLHDTAPFRDCPVMAELALFEWALRHTVDAADVERIDVASLEAMDAQQWAGLRCELHPSFMVLAFEWNAVPIWRALDSGEEPPLPQRNEQHWFVYRAADLTSQWRSADQLEASAIQCWAQGKNFTELCEWLAGVVEEEDMAVRTAATFMRTWVEQGLLSYGNTSAELERLS